LDGAYAREIRKQLLAEVRTELAGKMMEEVPAETRHLVHQVLDQHNYFVDPEKAGWYERRTLSQLSSDLLHGLELHLGTIQLDALADTSFRELPVSLRESVLSLLDSERLLADRAERLRLTQTGTLGDLSAGAREAVARHLGRQRLVEIRDRRPPALADDDREMVWAFLRDQGYFTDEFKEELFPYQRLDEFDAETRQTVEKALADQTALELDSKPIGDLSPELQASLKTRLSESGFFVDQSRLRQVHELPAESLPDELRQAVEVATGSHLLADLETTPVASLPARTQQALRRYLDQIGFFVDPKLQSKTLDRRLGDLGSELYDRIVADVAAYLRAEIGDTPVADLSEELRQGLREALEALGHFDSIEAREQALSQTLGSMRREDLEALAGVLGQAQLNAWHEKRLLDLPVADQEAILSHLQARDWFLDQARFEQMQSQPLRKLLDGSEHGVIETLRREQLDNLRNQRLATLSRDQRLQVHRALQDMGLDTEDSQTRLLQRQKLGELEDEVYRDLSWQLGSQLSADWGPAHFQDLDQEEQALIAAYLGRRIMGRIERRVLLHTISRLWIDYLTDIEDLRRGIGLEAYGQRDPLIEYKRRAFELFAELGDNIRRTVVRSLFQQVPEPLGAE
jgi:hypothetical protein